MWTVIIILAALVILGGACAWGPWEDTRHRGKQR